VRHERFHQHTTSAHFSPSRLVLIRFVHHRPGRRPWQPRKAVCARAADCVFRMALTGAASAGPPATSQANISPIASTRLDFDLRPERACALAEGVL
jgi:hypothetical protein